MQDSQCQTKIAQPSDAQDSEGALRSTRGHTKCTLTNPHNAPHNERLAQDIFSSCRSECVVASDASALPRERAFADESTKKCAADTLIPHSQPRNFRDRPIIQARRLVKDLILTGTRGSPSNYFECAPAIYRRKRKFPNAPSFQNTVSRQLDPGDLT